MNFWQVLEQIWHAFGQKNKGHELQEMYAYGPICEPPLSWTVRERVELNLSL